MGDLLAYLQSRLRHSHPTHVISMYTSMPKSNTKSHEFQNLQPLLFAPANPSATSLYWFARWDKISTIDKLRQKIHIIVNGCSMCLKDEESVHHLMIHCLFSYRVWIAILAMFGIQWSCLR
eukprot:TRINITY_DN5184_c4_g1_i1.p2 TRINITY_DN5184_c4_g1~~TRINITY_DN5184_c4_g1_i1.p2  ORF type:complete len:121 (-),score=5.70 TRINITY_DN5184_c4_g1_i1:400-762(-)